MADRGTQTGGSSGGRGRGIPLGAGSQTIKGGLLVLAAVILGIVLLQIVDPGKSGSVAQRSTTTTTRPTTTTTKKPGKTTTTTKGSAAAKRPAQIHLLVLNAGAPTGSAGSVSTTLKGKGYTNQGSPGNDPNPITGKEVLCRAGLTRERASLAVLLGSGTKQATISPGVPPGSTGYDCVVLIGG
jgi:hypothetical protein